MLEFPRWKKIFLWGLTLAVMAAALPTLFNIAGQNWPDNLPEPVVNPGLDLAGGSHILLEADPADVAAQRIENMEGAVETAMSRAQPRITISDVSRRGNQLRFLVSSPADVDRAREEILPLIDGNGLTREWDLSVVDGTRMVLTPTPEALDNAVTAAMESAIEVVRIRINELGTREPTILLQGDTRIVVQVPGLQDPDELKRLLGQTAKLEFKLVDLTRSAAELAQGDIPLGAQVFTYAEGDPLQGQPVAVRRLGGIQGDSLVDANAGVNQETREDIVSITFDAQGAEKFARLTTENVGRPFAIILDDQVISAPNINEPIRGGQAQISGSFTAETANELAISLRSGALPVDLAVIEERTVGPELGATSIRQGLLAMMIGSIAVIVLMIATYGRFGSYATFALILNVLMILGIMAMISTTLTLPGIAGFVLTVGAAVDANVLINERIREERRRGRRIIAAVETGYKEASRAIYDANVTNLIAGALLFIFGSGPVRGFAVVLVVGLFTSVFTALFLTRMWVAGWLKRKRPTELNI